MFGRYTPRARRVVYLAEALAQAGRHPQATDAHLLLAIVYEHQSSAAQALARLGLTRDTVTDAVCAALRDVPEAPWTGTTPLSPRLHTVLQDAAAEAIGLGCAAISTGHLLLSLAPERDSDGRGSAAEILGRLGVDPADVRDVTLGVLRGEDDEWPVIIDARHDHPGRDAGAVHEEVIQRLDKLGLVLERLDGRLTEHAVNAGRRLGHLEQQLEEHVGDSQRIQRVLGIAELRLVPHIEGLRNGIGDTTRTPLTCLLRPIGSDNFHSHELHQRS